MGILVDLQAMKAAVADPNIVKLDTRDVDEWIADSSSPYGKDFCPRKGPHPGAVWIEWYRMMKPTPTGPMFKSSDEILAEMRQRRRHAENAGRALLLQGRARLEHSGGAERGRHRERHALLRLVERMVARSRAADRDRAAVQDRGRKQRRGVSVRLPTRNSARPRESGDPVL